VLRETTSRGLGGLGCPSHTSERGGGILCEGYGKDKHLGSAGSPEP